MNKKNKFFIIGLIFLVLFMISAVSANENLTENIADDNSNDAISVENEKFEGNDSTDIVSVGVDINANNENNNEIYGENGDEEYSEFNQLKVSIYNYKSSYNFEDTVKIRVTDGNIALKNKHIDVYLENGYGELFPFWGTTNAYGMFNINLKNVNPGYYKISGNVGFEGYSVNKIIKVNKVPVNIYTAGRIGSTVSTILKATVKYPNGKLVNFGSVKFVINGKYYIADINNGVAIKKIKLPIAKTYIYKVYPYSHIYGKVSSSKVVVKQAVAKVMAIKCKTNVAIPASLRAIVKKTNGDPINEGYVLFKINGKFFKVKVNNGVAIRKIGLNKKNTYSYKAKFISLYYKSDVSESKIIVNNVMFKKGKFIFGLTAPQYKQLKYAQNHRHGDRIDLRIIAKTNQNYNYKKPIYSTIYSQKSKWVYVYKLASEEWWGDWGSEWENYDPVTPKGYTWCGSIYKSGDGWSETYYKYKKKVTYTTSEEVIVGYNTVKLPVYACISSRFTHSTFDPLNVIELRFMVNPFSEEPVSLRMPIYL